MSNKVRTTVQLSEIKLKKLKIIAIKTDQKDMDIFDKAIGDLIKRYENKNGVIDIN